MRYKSWQQARPTKLYCDIRQALKDGTIDSPGLPREPESERETKRETERERERGGGAVETKSLNHSITLF